MKQTKLESDFKVLESQHDKLTKKVNEFPNIKGNTISEKFKIAYGKLQFTWRTKRFVLWNKLAILAYQLNHKDVLNAIENEIGFYKQANRLIYENSLRLNPKYNNQFMNADFNVQNSTIQLNNSYTTFFAVYDLPKYKLKCNFDLSSTFEIIIDDNTNYLTVNVSKDNVEILCPDEFDVNFYIQHKDITWIIDSVMNHVLKILKNRNADYYEIIKSIVDK